MVVRCGGPWPWRSAKGVAAVHGAGWLAGWLAAAGGGDGGGSGSAAKRGKMEKDEIAERAPLEREKDHICVCVNVHVCVCVYVPK
uniref:Putative secreted protein n=1 Tax=Anopheles darlingi TaxID=43151 RepID=A0A2M4DK98_ANODA